MDPATTTALLLSDPRSRRVIAITVAAAVLVLAMAGLGVAALLLSVTSAPSSSCAAQQAAQVTQPRPSGTARNAIPSDYLTWFQTVGTQYHVPWVILAGIAKVESDDGQTTLPGVHSGANSAGAAGPMQIGIGGAAGNTWGGAPIHPASEQAGGVATDENGDGIADVYDPADAIAGAARYLLEHGVQHNVYGAIFAYNHLASYVQSVLSWAALYVKGSYTVTSAGGDSGCVPGAGLTSSGDAATAIAFAEQQIGKPYLWGGTGPDAFDCSGLTMMAYRAAGIDIPRTADQQWLWGPRVDPSQVQPGDLVFFAGADGTATAPGHVGIVIGRGLMIDAPSTGLLVRIEPYASSGAIGFTRPWAHAGAQINLAGGRP
jgi:cell wall-associated NlpC family hydrolase